MLFPSLGDLPDPGIEPRSPALQVDSLSSQPPGWEMLLKKVLIYSLLSVCGVKQSYIYLCVYIYMCVCAYNLSSLFLDSILANLPTC